MRTFGICASILAASNIVVFSVPAFAQPTAPRLDENEVRKAESPSPHEQKAEKPAPGTTAEAAASPEDGTVAVHLESPVPVSLERRAPGSTTWENVCTTPCDVRTSTVAEYRITGEGLNDSKPFMIDGTKEKVNLYAAPGSKSRADAGLYILVAGGVITIAGIAVLFLGANRSGTFRDDGETHGGHLNAMFFGGAIVLAGVTTGIFGAGWMIGNRHSDVEGDVAKVIDEKQVPGSSPSNAPGGGGVNGEVKFSTSSRQPTWNTPKTVGLPQVMSVPLLQGRF